MSVEKGRRGEDLALSYLEGCGLELLERNYRSRRGEIDLIMLEGKEVVFIEVRSRRCYKEAAESIDKRKRSRISEVALEYMEGKGELRCRFDAILLFGEGEIRWLRGAFEVEI